MQRVKPIYTLLILLLLILTFSLQAEPLSCLPQAYRFYKLRSKENIRLVERLEEWVFLPKEARKFNQKVYLSAKKRYQEVDADLTQLEPKNFSRKLALLDVLLENLGQYNLQSVAKRRTQGIWAKRKMALHIQNCFPARNLSRRQTLDCAGELFDLLHGQEFSLTPGINPNYKQWLGRMLETNLLSEGHIKYLDKFSYSSRRTLGQALRLQYLTTPIKWSFHMAMKVLLLPLGVTPKLSTLSFTKAFLKDFGQHGLDQALKKSGLIKRLGLRSHYAYQKYRKHLGLTIFLLDLALIQYLTLQKIEADIEAMEEARVQSMLEFPLRKIDDVLAKMTGERKTQLLNSIIKEFTQEEGRKPTPSELEFLKSMVFSQDD